MISHHFNCFHMISTVITNNEFAFISNALILMFRRLTPLEGGCLPLNPVSIPIDSLSIATDFRMSSITELY